MDTSVLFNFAIVFVAALGSAVIQRVAGFGFGIIMMTVLPFIMPSYGEAVTLSGLLACVTSVYVSWQMRKHMRWSMVIPMLVAFSVVSFFAVRLCASLPTGVMRKCFGGVLILISVYLYFFSSRIHVSVNTPVQILMGMLSGLFGGLFGVQGPPVVLYYLTALKSKEEYMAVLQTYYVVSTLIMTLFRWHCGFLTSSVALGWCYGVFGVLLGALLGAALFKRFSLDVLRKVIYVYMILSGIFILVN